MGLIEYLNKNNGKPEDKTWDQIATVFQLSSGNAARKRWARYKEDVDVDSKTIEVNEGSDADMPDLTGMKCIGRRETSPNRWVSSWKLIEEVSEGETTLEERLETSFEKILEKYDSYASEVTLTTYSKKGLIVVISDCHVGSEIDKNNMFGAEYNDTIFANNIQQVVDFVTSQRQINGMEYENFTMFDLGDSMDGWNGSTTRSLTGASSHSLPQNLDNGEQWETYVDVLTGAWKKIVEAGVAEQYSFVGASNSNHGGSFDYIAMKAVAKIIERLWGVDTFISKKFMDLYVVESNEVQYNYVFTHGKDEKDRKFGLPLVLEHKSREYIQGVIDKWKVPNTNKTVLLKGDLHQSASTRSQNKWHYVSCPSVFGSSGHSINNYTAVQPSFYFEVLDGEVRMTGIVDFD
jgi:hypothetical protein